MSASRWPWRLAVAASINSTLSVVRCSRVRSSAFGGRRSTVRFTIAGEVGGSGELLQWLRSFAGGDCSDFSCYMNGFACTLSKEAL